jgi:hypothetical protein
MAGHSGFSQIVIGAISPADQKCESELRKSKRLRPQISAPVCATASRAFLPTLPHSHGAPEVGLRSGVEALGRRISALLFRRFVERVRTTLSIWTKLVLAHLDHEGTICIELSCGNRGSRGVFSKTVRIRILSRAMRYLSVWQYFNAEDHCEMRSRPSTYWPIFASYKCSPQRKCNFSMTVYDPFSPHMLLHGESAIHNPRALHVSDGARTHLSNILNARAAENEILLSLLRFHNLHFLQPLDRSLFQMDRSTVFFPLINALCKISSSLEKTQMVAQATTIAQLVGNAWI